MPASLVRCVDPSVFFGCAYHELVHATGHKSRLHRPGVVDVVKFGGHAYSQEELVAEMGAAFLCAVAGIEEADGLPWL